MDLQEFTGALAEEQQHVPQPQRRLQGARSEPLGKPRLLQDNLSSDSSGSSSSSGIRRYGSPMNGGKVSLSDLCQEENRSSSSSHRSASVSEFPAFVSAPRAVCTGNHRQQNHPPIYTSSPSTWQRTTSGSSATELSPQISVVRFTPDSEMSSATAASAVTTAGGNACLSTGASVDDGGGESPGDLPKRSPSGVVRLPRLKLKGSGNSSGKKAKRNEMHAAEFERHRGDGGGAPLKRGPSWSRLNSAVKWLRSSYKSRNEDFRRLFGGEVPADAILIDDYSCALQRDILAHGRMYVSQEHFCFYANIFGWETFLVLPCRNITAIVRDKTVHVIPNAIKITTQGEDPSGEASNLRRSKRPGMKHYFFTSFLSRETSFQVLMKVWQNVLIGSHMNPQHLRSYVCRQWGHKPDCEDTESQFQRSLAAGPVPSDSSLLASSPHGPVSGTARSLSDPTNELSPTANLDSPALGSGSDEDFTDNDDRDGVDGPWSEEVCGCESHEGKVLIDRIVPTRPSLLFKLLYTPSPFILDFFKDRGIFAVEMEKWETKEGSDDSDEGEHRTVSYKLPMDIPMGPKFATTTEEQHLLGRRNLPKVYVVQVDVTSCGVPMGNAFSTRVRACITRAANQGTSRLFVTGGVVFHKSVLSMMKKMIEREAASGMAKHYNALSDAINKHFMQNPSSSPARQLVTLSPGKDASPHHHSASDSSDISPDIGTRPDSPPRVDPASKASPQSVVSLPQPSTVLSFLLSVSLRSVLYMVMACVSLILLYQYGSSLLGSFRLPSTADTTATAGCPAPPTMEQPGESAMSAAFVSSQEWIDLLRLQHALHQQDIERWQELLHTTSSTLANVSVMLQKLLVKQALILQAQMRSQNSSTAALAQENG